MPGLSGKRILVVEDEYFIAADLKRALLREGAEVVGPVGQLREGLMLVDKGTLDAALLDVNLDSQSSFELADHLRDAGVPHMFLTGYDDWAIPAGHDETVRLTKPCPTPMVLDAVAGLLRESP